jgi:Leucine-rich repeat (LRR) protein
MSNLRLTPRTEERSDNLARFFLAIAAAGMLLYSPSPVQAAISQQEREGLIALFNGLDGINWTNKSGWLQTPGTECNWYGVSCDATRQSVTGLTLPQNELRGSIPAEIAKLTNLQILNLNGNLIYGIPDAIGSLANLHLLDLGDTDISTPIPSALGNLSQLQTLLISGYWLTGGIPAELGKLKQLRSLRLINYGGYHYQMGLGGRIPAEFGNLTNLETLELVGNQLEGGIPVELGNLTNLKVLNLSAGSWVGLEGSIPDSLGNLRNLQSLKLRGNRLTGDIPSSLFDLVNLQQLDLAINLLNGIPAEIARLTNLRVFDWSYACLKSIPIELGSMTNLQDLELNGTYLNSIPAEFGNLRGLQILGLSNNQLSSLPAELGNLANLQTLDLSNNKLTGIPAGLGNLRNLQRLNISNNQLETDIPATLSGLTNLMLLDLSHNQLKSIPVELGDLKNLQYVDLTFNQLSGSIPSSLGNLTSLDSLFLAANQLSGAIPPSLGNLTKLTWLSAGGNKLSGSIPSELGNLANIQILGLDENQLSGSIPAQLGNLSNLLSLGLSGNQLSGSIPGELGNLRNLYELVLSDNQLSGTIPPSLGNLPNLSWLSLGGNKVSGPFPAALTISASLYPDLNYNALYANDRNSRNFLDSRAVGWDKTQTVAPSNGSAILQLDSSILVSWQPIPFSDYGGRYEVWARTGGGASVLAGSTTDKRASSLVLPGLSPSARYRLRTISDPNPHNQNMVVSDFSAEISVTIPVVSQSLSLGGGGATFSSTFGSTGAAQTGYAVVTLNPGNAPYGTAVLSYRQNGVTVSECGVPASPPTTSVRFFVDYRTGTTIPGSEGKVDIYTGFAAVNRGDGTAIMNLTLRDLAGQPITSGVGTLASGAHIAKYVHQLADILPGFSIPSSFPTANGYGTLELTSNQPLSVVALRLTINQRGETLLTTTPVADLTQPSTSTAIYFPQIADGGGYSTTIILLNASNSVETGTMRLFDDIGSPLTVQLLNGSSGTSFDYSIPPGSASVYQTDASPAAVSVGWMELTPGDRTAVPVGAGIFQYSQSGILLAESGIPSVTPTKHARIFVDLSAGHDVGLALGNPGNAPINIWFAAFEMDGTSQIGTSNGGGDWLNTKGHSAYFVDQRVSCLPADFRGVLDIASDSPFAALTLRSLVNERSEFLLTTFPVADLSKPAPFPIIFPQIADGGGYRTEFILISTGPSGSATVGFFGDGGTEIAIGR